MNPKDVWRAEGRVSPNGPMFITTYSGGTFSYNEFGPDDIEITDIAHSLSQLCRFNGHTNLFYSVAQHSLLVAEKMPGGPKAKLVGLLHDAAEAYTNDLASPLKGWLDDQGDVEYCNLQDRITAAIYKGFGVETIPDDVRLYDLAACVFEAEGLMGLSEETLHEYRFPTHLRGLWSPWNPKEWAGTNGDRECGEIEHSFLRRFEELMVACGRAHLI